MSQFLFLFTIGPVQSFIIQARKNHDLYAGSNILSDLTDYAIKQLPLGSKLLFPHEEIEFKSNKFMALINCLNPCDIGENLKSRIQDKMRDIANHAFANSNLLKKPSSFDKHISDFPDIYWVAVPFNDKDDYTQKYKQLTRLLGMVKNTRTFEQLSEAGRKCSICGERNALFYKSNQDKDGKERKPRYLDENSVQVHDFRVAQGEGLCGVCFTKRYYNKKDEKKDDQREFPSTAKIALLHVLSILDGDSQGKKIKKEFETFFDTNAFDAQFFYAENLTEKYFIKNGLNRKKLEQIRAKNEEVKRYAEELGKSKGQKLNFSKYYAAITFDGDDMGKRLAGEGLKEEVSLQHYHYELSKRLGEFAGFASKYLNDQERGRCVYAEGDDFLGFVNLHHLFGVMDKLNSSFDEKVNAPLKGKYLKENEDLTFSAGIIIAHYKTPLNEVLNRAREVVNIAKNSNSEKNAFCIAVLKRSGEYEQAVCKWDLNELKSVEAMHHIVKALDDEGFSRMFITHLSMEMVGLIDRQGVFFTGSGLENDILEMEIKRLILRLCHLEKKKEAVSNLFTNIYKLYRGNRYFVGNNQKIKNFISLLNILDFIQRKR